MKIAIEKIKVSARVRNPVSQGTQGIKIEISENEQREPFTYSIKLDYG